MPSSPERQYPNLDKQTPLRPPTRPPAPSQTTARPPTPKKVDPYTDRLSKFVGQKVEVYIQGTDTVLVGTLVAYQLQHLNVIITTDTNEIVVRNVSHVSRVRS